ncbi:hypothetical protein BaRGS_00018201 [Batillaria attramentaria]|uniref:Uncharacterized protein n=1 Tax=Batillaria attramentaria TaxID=370345 RepID=A0ABD0KTN0_9CAEN
MGSTSRDILECFQPTLQQQCPSHVSGILTGLYLAFQPPICQVDTREETSTVRPCSGSAPFATAGGGEAMMMISTVVLWVVSFRFGS